MTKQKKLGILKIKCLYRIHKSSVYQYRYQNTELKMIALSENKGYNKKNPIRQTLKTLCVLKKNRRTGKMT
jgi:hypothetical protein